MDAEAALAELSELSAQVETAAVLRDGAVEALVGDRRRSNAFPRGGRPARRGGRPFGQAGPEVERVEVVLPEGGVFVVRAGGRTASGRRCPSRPRASCCTTCAPASAGSRRPAAEAATEEGRCVG